MPRRLLLVILVLPLTACGGTSRGPLAYSEDSGSSWVGGGVRPGQLNVTALHLRTFEGDKPAVLLGARPADAKEARGLTLRYAATTGAGAHIGGDRGWKPRAWDLHALVGFQIRPGQDAAIVVGATSSRPGIYFVRSFVVDYRIGGTHYRATYRQGIETCVGRPSCPD